MLEKDREKRLHSPDLYAIWNLKTYMMSIASNFNPFNSEFFIYTDTGAWRQKGLTDWPDQSFVRALKHKLNDRILYGQIRNPNLVNFSPRSDFIEGILN